MTALTNKTSSKRRLLLASDRSDQSSELASILQTVGQVDTITTSQIPEAPARDLSGPTQGTRWMERAARDGVGEALAQHLRATGTTKPIFRWRILSVR